MSSAYESADLIIKLYDLRREEKMRKAREWYTKEFHPASARDVVNTLRGEHSAYFRMVTSYWEMAASFVNQSAIDWKMFMDANTGEPVNVFAKLYPYLEELRSMFASKYDERAAFQHLEQVVMQLPHAKEQIAERIEQFKEAQATLGSGKQNTTGVIHQWPLSNVLPLRLNRNVGEGNYESLYQIALAFVSEFLVCVTTRSAT